jgi:hypothetical protein
MTLVIATASCGVLGVLVAEGRVAGELGAMFITTGAVLGLTFMLRVGVYKPSNGRGELVRASR